MSLKEAVTCPTILEVARLNFSPNSLAAIRNRRKFDVSLGTYETIHVVKFRVTIEFVFSGTVSLNDFMRVMCGLSYLNNEIVEGTVESRETRWERRDDLITDFYFTSGKVGTVAGYVPTKHVEEINYNPDKCLVRTPGLDINVSANTNDQMSFNILAEIYYTKEGVTKSILTQLLKVYNDAKAIYRQA